ncbi:MAG: sulfurtransferase-like selenium metabolism protein YedF [Syntrophaceae bacterium]|nr:sulfurtransferase-like selenium metabolism protein YedF [Syntrophaceae bacterium]
MTSPFMVDTRRLNCPQPVLLAKKAMDNLDINEFLILVDNRISKENLCRFINSQGLEYTVKELGSDSYEILASRSQKEFSSPQAPSDTPYNLECSEDSSIVIYVGTCAMGSGDYELGIKLMRGFLRTLIDMDFRPWRMIFINSGVKLTSTDEEATEALNMMAEKGVEILSCGTCLKHYGLEDKLAVGRTTTMYEVIESLHQAKKVISPD